MHEPQTLALRPCFTQREALVFLNHCAPYIYVDAYSTLSLRPCLILGFANSV